MRGPAMTRPVDKVTARARIERVVNDAAVPKRCYPHDLYCLPRTVAAKLILRELAKERGRVRRIVRSDKWVNIADLLAMINGTFKPRRASRKKPKPDTPHTQWLPPQNALRKGTR